MFRRPVDRGVIHILNGAALLAGLGLYAWRCVATNYFDFYLYRASGRALSKGSYRDVNLVNDVAHQTGMFDGTFSEQAYGSPFLVGVIFRPLSYLAFAEPLYSVAVAGLLAYVSFRISRRYFGFVFTVLVMGAPVLNAITLGNWALVTACLLTLAYLDLRDGNERRAVVLISIAAVFKIYPVLFLLPFILKRQWKLLKVAAVIGSVSYAFAVVVMGWTKFADTFALMLGVNKLGSFHAVSYSLPSAVYRWTNNEFAGSFSMVVLMIGLISLLYLFRKAPTVDLFVFAVVSAMIAMTFTWDSYFIGLVPVALWLWAQEPSRSRIIGFIGIATVWFVAYGLEPDELIPVDILRPYVPATLVVAFCVGRIIRSKIETDSQQSEMDSKTSGEAEHDLAS